MAGDDKTKIWWPIADVPFSEILAVSQSAANFKSLERQDDGALWQVAS